MLCFFRGIDNRNQTEELSDKALFIEPSLLLYSEPLQDPGLIGFTVQDEEGKELGRLAGMFDAVAHFIWRIEEDDREWLLPAIEEFVLEVDEENQLIRVRLIPGLYDDDAEEVPHG